MAPLAWWMSSKIDAAQTVFYTDSAPFNERRDAFALLRLSPVHGDAARRRWAEDWRRRALIAERSGDRDTALLYRLEEIAADPSNADAARRQAAVLAGSPYHLLVGAFDLDMQPDFRFRGEVLDVVLRGRSFSWISRDGSIEEPCPSEFCRSLTVQSEPVLPKKLASADLLAPLLAVGRFEEDSGSRVTVRPTPRFVTVESDSYTQLWTADGKSQNGTMLGRRAERAALSRSGRLLATWSGGRLSVWDLSPLRLSVAKTTRIRGDAVAAAEFRNVSAVLRGSRLYVFREGNEQRLEPGFRISSLAMSRDGRLLAAAGDKFVRLWTLEEDGRPSTLVHDEPADALLQLQKHLVSPLGPLAGSHFGD
jgi:hypothetical protein